MEILPTTAHSAIVRSQTDCGKTVFILDLLKGPYRKVFDHIVILCPTVKCNTAYHSGEWVWTDDGVYIIDPGEQFHEWLRTLYNIFQGEQTLYIIDDCSAKKALTKTKDMLSELALSGRHAQQNVWVVTQKYNSVLKYLREQTRWLAFFHCKNRDSYENCLRGNDIIPT